MQTPAHSLALYTVGHSNHPLERFLDLLRQHGIEAICDVRSHPYSQHCPHFNREALAAVLNDNGLHYAFFGDELGARTHDPGCYDRGKVVYARLARIAPFQAGLGRLRLAMRSRRVALMCAEKDPLTCHRAILVCRHLRSDTDAILHILESGETETQSEAELRLMDLLNIGPNLFESDEELVERAYDTQSARIAYEAPKAGAAPEGGEPWA